MAAPLYLLIKPVSGECGLHCRYCFYRDITRSREVPSYGQMTEDTARTLIAKAMAYGRSAYVFAFQGGEHHPAGAGFLPPLPGAGGAGQHTPGSGLLCHTDQRDASGRPVGGVSGSESVSHGTVGGRDPGYSRFFPGRRAGARLLLGRAAGGPPAGGGGGRL